MAQRLLIFVTEDWYFVSHRLPLAVAAKAAGFDVTVVTRVGRYAETIQGAGITLIAFDHARTGMNPVRELMTLFRLVAVYRAVRPHVVHHVAMKPVLYGTIAARIVGTVRVVNALAGMGWLFTSTSARASLLRQVVRRALAAALRRGTVIVQNGDDRQLVAALGVPTDRIILIPGSGVDLTVFRPSDEPAGPVVVLFPARLLWDKGVREFLGAARLLRARGVRARFVLAGDPDPANPSSISEAEVAGWSKEGVVEHLGWVTDMASLFRDAHVVCLPSHREGLPKALLEAAASGRPIVTTDTPGCRDVVRHGENGLLVPVQDSEALAAALELLIADPEARAVMGTRSRRRAETLYGVDAIVTQTIALYRANGN